MKYRRQMPAVVLMLLGGWLGYQPFSAWAASEPIQVGIYDNRPKVFIDEENEPGGFWPGLLDAIAATENWTLDYVVCEWDDCLQALETGDLDLMLDVSYIEERELRFDFNQEVVVSTWSVVYVREGETLNTLVDLDGSRLGVLADGVQYKALSKRVKHFAVAPEFVPAPNYDLMLQWLADGTIDAAVINKYTGTLAEAYYPIAKTNILVAPTEVYFAAPDGENADLLQAIDNRLRELKADPDSVYYQLLDEWMTIDAPVDWRAIREALRIPFVIGLGTLAIAVTLWNRRLKREIARRQQTETALIESQDWLQRVLSAAEILCWEEDLATGRIQYLGRYTPEGWQAERWQLSVNDCWADMIHPEDCDRVRAARETAIAHGGEFNLEHRITPSEDTVMWVLSIGQVMMDAAGKPQKLVGSSIDITALKEAQKSLIAREEQLRLSLELTAIGTWDWQISRDRLTWNDNHYRILGYEPGSIEPSYDVWEQTIHDADRPRILHAMETALATHSAYSEEYRVVHPDGRVHWLLGHGCGLYNEQGEPVRMLGVVLDITERKHMEEALRYSEATKRQVLEAIPDLLIWMKTDGTCIGLAGGGGLVNLLAVADFIGLNQYEKLPPAVSAARRQAVEAVQRTGAMQMYEQQVEIDGEIQHEEVRVTPIEGDAVLVIIRNINDRKHAELALAASEQRFRLVTENMTDLVCLHAADGRYLYVTPSCQTLLGYTQDDLIGQNPYDYFHPDDVDEIRESHTVALTRDAMPVTYRFRHQAGHDIWLETLTQPIWDDAGQMLYLQTTSRDVSDRVSMEQRLRHDALHDTLTDLPNRALLLERIELAVRRLKSHPGTEFAVLFVDCDRFKIVNDSLGHSVGDQLLQAIADKFRRAISDTDVVARIGGDEFVFLLEEIESPNTVIEFAERLIADLRSPFQITGQPVFLSASIGIAFSHAGILSAETLLRNADIAMYRAKASGRSSYAIFDPEMHTQVLEHLKLENDLRHALERQEFVLFYQPIVSLETLQIVGFETLIRWQHPTAGLLAPDRFIHIVEETGLIEPLGQWILDTACQQVSQWQTQIATAADLRLSVNLSVKQLREAVLLPQLWQVLSSSCIKPSCLTLEITEGLLVENIDSTCQLLYQVQQLGVNISIDDFGTGYSSLSYLHQLPVDSLKIDRSFVSPSEPTPRNQTIAASIIGLSRLLDLKAIAEGIETRDQLDWLRSLDCEYGQGYFFSKPVPASDAENLLLMPDGFATCLPASVS